MKKAMKTSRIDELEHANKVMKTLYNIANSVNTTESLDTLYQAIHTALKQVMDVTNFFIAIIDREKRTLFFPYHVDEFDDDFSAISDFDTNDSLTGLVVQQGKPMMMKKAALEKRAKKGGVWGPVPLIWLGVPLKVKGEIIGVVAVQNYEDPDCYTQKDIDLLTSVSDQIAVAIDRKRAEERLEKSENKFAKLFAATPCWCLLSVVKTGEIIEANETFFKTSGYTRDEVIGKTGAQFGMIVDKKYRKKALDEYFRTGMLKDFPVQFRLKNGSVRDFLWSAQTHSMDDRLCWVSAMLDITDQKNAQQERQRADHLAAEQEKHALIGRVAGKMSHDFNNILGAIMGNTELALLDCEEGEIKQTLELIYGQTLRGKNLTKNLTAFAKNQDPKHAAFKINDTFDLVLSLLKKDLDGIAVTKDYQADIPDLIADPGMIEHAVVNLVQNAVHALSKTETPRISVRTFHEGNHIGFEISDNGCGIPDEYMERIFEPGFTLKGGNDVEESYAGGIKGTGYGMSNVMRYIDQHKGGIYVESRQGQGTKFVARLPRIRRQLTQNEVVELEKTALIKQKRILLVEDEKVISDIQYRVLTQPPCRHTVDIAMDGQKAQEMIKSKSYDMVSLDYQLPGKVSGMDLYHEIRAVYPLLPILFVSGNIEFLESIDQLKQLPNIDYISKPCPNKAYLTAVNNLLAAGLNSG